MPLYDYECSKCGHKEEIFHGYNEKVTKCPSCGKKKFRIVILSSPYCTVKEIKTVGQLADSNWKKMGTYEREKKMLEDGVKETLEKREKAKFVNKVSNMTPEQKTKYIVEGKI